MLSPSPVRFLLLCPLLLVLLTACGRRDYPVDRLPAEVLLKSISGYAVSIGVRHEAGKLTLIQHPQLCKPQPLVLERRVVSLHVIGNDQLHVKFAGQESLRNGVLTWVYVANDRGLLVKVDEVGVVDLLPRKR